ncbi:MAG: type 2 isopentenyl-diphosphate Delta-isomerase [Bdellovibrionales bacterium]|nr:type 2 isopentenyl-diphosphate Delta-isomerase [Bdellovibrionales bacterium]
MSDSKFIHRKQDHLRVALLDEVQANESRVLDRVELIHESLPEINLGEVSIESSFFERTVATPFYISGMTSGHDDAYEINLRLARIASERGWLFGLGSQRRELDEAFNDSGIDSIVSTYTDLKLVSNLGLSQLIELYQSPDRSASAKKIERITQRSRASLLAIHLNPLQEAIQPEGTPNFKHGVESLEWLIEHSAIPVLVKETGSGMSYSTLMKLRGLKLFAVDVSGLGGTHWGRVEGHRADKETRTFRYGETFKNWGVSTVESVIDAMTVFRGSATEVWASGGVRTGLDAAKLLAMGCQRVGFAQPALKAAMQGELEVNQWMQTVEQELKIAMFCSGSATLGDLHEGKLK